MVPANWSYHEFMSVLQCCRMAVIKLYSSSVTRVSISQGLEMGSIFLSRTGSGTSRALSARAAPCRWWAPASSPTAAIFCAQTATVTTERRRWRPTEKLWILDALHMNTALLPHSVKLRLSSAHSSVCTSVLWRYVYNLFFFSIFYVSQIEYTKDTCKPLN